jgi:deaminated glutathione amidase
MADTLRVACVQMTSGPDKAANIERAERLVAEAAAAGADLVVLPEKWNAIGPPDVLHAAGEPLEAGESVDAMSGWAARHGITLVGGSITERRDGRDKLSNTSLVFDRSGELTAVYRKIHLFDVDLPDGTRLRESDTVEPGSVPVVTETRFGTLGLSVCYDLRFPELYRALVDRGAIALTIPAAFTLTTGKDHWHVLLRARAIEAQSYVIAAAQTGRHFGQRVSYGHALICDPWGTILSECGEGEGYAIATIDPAVVERVRNSIPSLRHRKL